MKKQSPAKQRAPQKPRKEEGETNKPEIPASRIRGKRTSGVKKGVKQNQIPERILSEKEYWKKLTESATLWIWQTDANLRHVYSNPFVTKYLGYKPADFLQLDTLSLIHPDDHALVAELVRKARTEKAGWHDQLMRWRHRDGSWRFVESSGWPLFDDEGNFAGLRGADKDVTDSVLMKETLNMKEAAIASSNNGISFADPDGNLTYANQAFLTMWGYGSEEEVLGRSAAEFWMSREAALRVIREISVSGRWSGELTARKKDGSPFFVELSANAVKDHAGRPISLMASFIDITKRKQNEQMLADSERKYRLLFESSTDAIFILDLNGNFIDVNKTAYMRLGYTKEEMLSLHIKQLDPPEFAARVPERLALIEKLGMAVFESAHVRKDGSIMPVEINSRLLDYEGRKVYFSVIRDITERKKAEQALQESEERYRLLFEDSTDAVFVHSLTDNHMPGKFLAVNDVACRLLGYSRGELLNMTPLDIDAPDSAVDLQLFAEKLMRGESVLFEQTNIAKDGRRVEVEIHLRSIMMKGQPVVLAVVRDIGERRKRQNRRIKIRDCLLGLSETDHAGNINTLTSLTGELIEADCALYNRLDKGLLCVRGQWSAPPDLKKEDYPEGHICFDVIQRDNPHPLVVTKLQDSSYAKTDPNVEAYGLKTYIGCKVQFGLKLIGSLCCVFTRDYEPTSDDLEVMTIMSAAIAQEEKRNEAVKQLRESEQFIRDILDSVDVGLIVVDPDYRILLANQAYSRQVEMSCDSIIGRKCFTVSHGTQKPCWEEGEICSVKQACETGKPQTTIHRHTNKDGNTLLAEIKAFPIKFEAGRVVSVIQTCSDITEKHLLEQERLKTQKLESIGLLAGGIAHDFNNLLQGIFGYTSLAMMSLDNPETVKDMLRQAEKALHLAVNLTTQLLTFSKGGKPVKRVIRIGPVIESAVKFSLSGSQADYSCDLAADLWPVEADEGQMAQVIQNIVLNADQAMSGKGTVHISAVNREIPRGAKQGLPAGGRFVQIAFLDSGIGIPSENLIKIFDPYFTTKQKGSGLGLATSYSIVRNHGGIIEVESEMGKGSTFTIYLPATEGIDLSGKQTPSVVSEKKGRILFMDDEEVVRSVARDMMTALGHEVKCAADGRQAIEMFLEARESGNPFDLLIFDLTVKGGMGGEEAILKIREIDPSVVALVSSGYSDNPVVADFSAYGFSGVLNKPYKISELRTCLNELLNRA